MSEAEILEEQKKLMESIDPNLLKFLTGKRRTQIHAKPHQDIEVDSSPVTSGARLTEDSVKNIKEEETKEGVDENLRGFPNMNRDEPEKREWMSDIPKVNIMSCY